jgi:hypothetical protein
MITNIGSLFMVIIGAPLTIAIIAFFDRVWPFWKNFKSGKKVQFYIDHKRKEILYNKLIMFVNETYLVLAVTSFVNLRIITKNYTSAQYF